MTEEELKTFDFTSVNIADLLPQRKPFVMISSLLSCSYERTVTRFLIQEDNVFVEDGRLVPEGLVENIAQTCAARIGFINKYILHKPVSVGYVCALKDFKVQKTPVAGETIETEINLKGEFGTMLMVDAIVKSDGNMLAEGSMVIALDESRPMGGHKAVVKVADNIISPLGTTTEENYAAVKAGKSALRLYESSKNLPEPFFASLIDEDSLADEYAGIDSSARIDEYAGLDGLTRFEKRIILSVSKALKGTGIDPSSEDVLFVVSSTKGNVELLDNEAEPCGGDPAERERLGNSAEKIARFFGNRNTPIVKRLYLRTLRPDYGNEGTSGRKIRHGDRDRIRCPVTFHHLRFPIVQGLVAGGLQAVRRPEKRSESRRGRRHDHIPVQDTRSG